MRSRNDGWFTFKSSSTSLTISSSNSLRNLSKSMVSYIDTKFYFRNNVKNKTAKYFGKRKSKNNQKKKRKRRKIKIYSINLNPETNRGMAKFGTETRMDARKPLEISKFLLGSGRGTRVRYGAFTLGQSTMAAQQQNQPPNNNRIVVTRAIVTAIKPGLTTVTPVRNRTNANVLGGATLMGGAVNGAGAGGNIGIGGGIQTQLRRPSPHKPTAMSASKDQAIAQRQKSPLRRRLSCRSEQTPQTKWILRPRGFKYASTESSSESVGPLKQLETLEEQPAANEGSQESQESKSIGQRLHSSYEQLERHMQELRLKTSWPAFVAQIAEEKHDERERERQHKERQQKIIEIDAASIKARRRRFIQRQQLQQSNQQQLRMSGARRTAAGGGGGGGCGGIGGGALRTYSVPSQRIMLEEDLKHAQLRLLQPRRTSSHRQLLQQQREPTRTATTTSKPPKSGASKVSLLQADVAKTTPSTYNRETVTKQQQELAAEMTINKPKSSSSSSSSSNNSNNNNHSTQTSSTSRSSGGNMWSNDQTYLTPIVQNLGNSKSIKLTSTVIKIMPNVDKPATTTAIQQQHQEQQQPQRQFLQILKRQSAGKQHPQVSQKQTALQQRQPQNQGLEHPNHNPNPNPNSNPNPNQQQQRQQLPRDGPSPKIVRKVQHKVPRTIEDGIDVSYQTFVSKPLQRGRKPQTIRYLYRPMVRNLNAATPSQLQRKRARKSKKEHEHEQDQDQEPGTGETETETVLMFLKAAAEAHKSSGDCNGHAEKNESHIVGFRAPNLKVGAKYMSYMQQLSRMSGPNERCLGGEHAPEEREQQQPSRHDPHQHQPNQQQQQKQQEQQQLTTNQEELQPLRPTLFFKPQSLRPKINLISNYNAKQNATPTKRSQPQPQAQAQAAATHEALPNAKRLNSLAAGANIYYHEPINLQFAGTAIPALMVPGNKREDALQQHMAKKGSVKRSNLKTVSFKIGKNGEAKSAGNATAPTKVRSKASGKSHNNNISSNNISNNSRM
ncbi:putative uncharacterized protein DDB_G0271606 [Scaptodrosophila lebanonensis]|uniref:Uncharacterized protein n=1 Tax=Drosophila lebanonensis TaxID=7225 RepID=A0A6J2U1W0_DROLE|nr:putative uncharacterized protein DDB_G0271606 [Scaptodrosophila lebanonensis]